MPDEIRNRFFARMYARMGDSAEIEEHRRRTLARLEGNVIEVGCGDGRNFAHYPEAVTEVLAVEPEPYLRARAEEAARRSAVPVKVVAGVADRLPADDASFDAGVTSLVLCSVPDQARALAELRRVIRPGGELRFYEHVVSRSPARARGERIAGVVWPHIAGGCHLDRDTASSIEAAGFEIEDCDRFGFSPGFPIPSIAHVIGSARRPA